jgi:phosphate-selective porin OprO and OprP
VATVDKGLNNLEFAATAGALKFQYEAASVTLDATAPNITNGGTPGTTKTASLSLKSTTQYYEVFYNLTGESWADAYKGGSFTGVKPNSNYVFGKGGTGAWQMGVRVSQYKVNLPGFVTIANDGGNNLSRAENSEQAKTITYGLNWLLNPNSRVMFNYATTQFDRPVYLLSSTDTSSRSSRENIFSIRTQINF